MHVHPLLGIVTKSNLRDLVNFRSCGLLLWVVHAQQVHYDSKCEERSVGT